MAYTTQAKIEAYIGRSLSTSEVTNLTDLLPSVDSIIDEILGSSYLDSTRTFYFDGGDSVIDLPGLSTVTSVNYYDSDTDTLEPISTSLYKVYPLNSACKLYIRMIDGEFQEGLGNVAVVGNTGAAPNDIVLAATIMAADFINTAGSAGALVEERIGDWTKKYASGADSSNGTRTKVLQLLAPYRDIMI